MIFEASIKLLTGISFIGMLSTIGTMIVTNDCNLSAAAGITMCISIGTAISIFFVHLAILQDYIRCERLTNVVTNEVIRIYNESLET